MQPRARCGQCLGNQSLEQAVGGLVGPWGSKCRRAVGTGLIGARKEATDLKKVV